MKRYLNKAKQVGYKKNQDLVLAWAKLLGQVVLIGKVVEEILKMFI